VQRKLARFRELPVADREHAVVLIEIGTVQRDRFPDPHTGHREQPDQRAHGHGPVRGTQRARGVHQRDDLLLAIDERDGPMRHVGQQIDGRNLDPVADRREIPREPADRSEPVGPPRLTASRDLCPPQRGRGRDLRLAALLEEREELVQQLLLAPQSVPQRATHRQVLAQPRLERAHREDPGHGRAISLSRSRSTFA
jgi:hypothetical protein